MLARRIETLAVCIIGLFGLPSISRFAESLVVRGLAGVFTEPTMTAFGLALAAGVFAGVGWAWLWRAFASACGVTPYPMELAVPALLTLNGTFLAKNSIWYTVHGVYRPLLLGFSTGVLIGLLVGRFVFLPLRKRPPLANSSPKSDWRRYWRMPGNP